MIRSLALVLATLGLACTSTDPRSAPEVVSGAVSAPSPATKTPDHRLDLPLMYWAPSHYILGSNPALVFGAEVSEVHRRPAEHPELRGETIDEATLRVTRVLRQVQPSDTEPGEAKPALRAGHRVTTDAADGVQPGDRVLVFATAYEGSYAIAPARGTTTPLGIVVRSWSDPIVEATVRWLAGTADLDSDADADPWRPYGDAAIRCMREGIPVSHC